MYTEISMVGPTVVNTDLPSQIDSDNREIRTDIKPESTSLSIFKYMICLLYY